MSPASPQVEAVLAGLSLDARLDQMLLAAPQVDRAAEVTVGGVLIVAPVSHDLDRVRDTVARSTARSRVPPLVAMDVEGGWVNPLRTEPGLAGLPSADALGRRPVEEVEAWGYRAGVALHQLGVTIDLAPVMDVADSGHLHDDRRTFGGDPATVAAKGAAFARGLWRAGVAPIGKHFPGYGDLPLDSDRERAVAPWTRAEIADRAAVFADAGLAGVMMSNAVYTAFGDQPAVFVPELVALARSTTDGLVVTDDLLATPLAEAAGSEEGAVRAAFLAGNDLLTWTAPPDWKVDVHRVLAAVVDADPALEERVDASVRRILTLKETLGLLGQGSELPALEDHRAEIRR